MSVETDVATLQKQVAHFLTAAQIRALVAEQGINYTTLLATVNAQAATITSLIAEVQSLKDQVADLETRVTALE